MVVRIELDNCFQSLSLKDTPMVAVKYNPENCLARFFGQINNVDLAVFSCPIFTGLDLFCQKLPGKWCVCVHCIGGGTWYTPMSSTQYVGDILRLFPI